MGLREPLRSFWAGISRGRSLRPSLWPGAQHPDPIKQHHDFLGTKPRSREGKRPPRGQAAGPGRAEYLLQNSLCFVR